MIDISKRKILVFDIEAASYDFETYFDDATKEYLTKYAKNDDEKLEAIEALVFSPFTSQIVTIGMYDVNLDKGCALINGEANILIESSRENIVFESYDEKGLIERFWKIVREKNYNLFVTFNGREFDCPFLMLRSIILGLKPGYHLMKGTDFNFRDYHIDLLKEFTFMKHSPRGARRKYSLDFYCKTFGIKSPKCDGMSGDQVGALYINKEYKKIAEYGIDDEKAKSQLIKHRNSYLNI
jgi:DNA polymerase elongation subunit (family B)